MHTIKDNIVSESYSTHILQGRVQEVEFQVYAYLGKFSKPKLRVVALSYALKLNHLLNSSKKLAILSGGGVLRQKKLQKGSNLSFLPPSSLEKEVIDHN